MPNTVDVSGLDTSSVKVVESLVALLRKKVVPVEMKPLSAKKLDTLFDSLSKGLPDIPELPADFSRQDIYSDHD